MHSTQQKEQQKQTLTATNDFILTFCGDPDQFKRAFCEQHQQSKGMKMTIKSPFDRLEEENSHEI
ncbi:hypothetical protein [Psychromonas aquimarina]|uniref:hypothetical protein n=1 Tax=Psychromonas aquimarina TaxID=444919 RepID=UPI00048CB7B9|nr:hypothetical protein [Psychromonas aquimarina]